MGVYISKMEKPKDCYLCEFTNGYECWSNGEPWFDVEEAYAKGTLSPNCPLTEIVTCGECKWIGVDDGMPFCYWWLREIEPDVFCSYAERRADGDI